MVRNVLKILTVLLGAAILSSCLKLEQSVIVISGNESYRSGDYQDSIMSYLDGIKMDEYKEYFYYNLGNVYTSLGEYPSAMEAWDKAALSREPLLLFDIYFNQGLLEYQLGHYDNAYNMFREALKINSRDIDAKINLEISLKKINASLKGGRSPVKTDRNGEESSDETKRILDYVKRKEGVTWGKKEQDGPLENDW